MSTRGLQRSHIHIFHTEFSGTSTVNGFSAVLTRIQPNSLTHQPELKRIDRNETNKPQEARKRFTVFQPTQSEFYQKVKNFFFV